MASRTLSSSTGHGYAKLDLTAHIIKLISGDVMFTRRLDYNVNGTPNLCSGGHGCPALLELEAGDLAVIGRDITDAASPHLPTDCGCGAGERIIQIPRSVLITASQTLLKSPAAVS